MERLGDGSVIEPEHFTKSLSALDGAGGELPAATRLDQPVLQPLVIALAMIVRGEFSSRLRRATWRQPASVTAWVAG